MAFLVGQPGAGSRKPAPGPWQASHPLPAQKEMSAGSADSPAPGLETGLLPILAPLIGCRSSWEQKGQFSDTCRPCSPMAEFRACQPVPGPERCSRRHSAPSFQGPLLAGSPPGSQGHQEPLLSRCGLSRRDHPSGRERPICGTKAWQRRVATEPGHPTNPQIRGRR